MKRQTLYFTGPYTVEVREEPAMAPGFGQMLVQVIASAISPGTELLIYRDQFPPDLPLDETITALQGGFSYPVRYGYAVVGRVIQLGAGVGAEWSDRLVFAFQPHQSHFLAAPDDLLPVPDHISPEDALFLPNMETAINFLHDGRPLVGEQVAIFGQGIVGLLTTALLAKLPLACLVTLDPYPLRRTASLALGAHASLDPFRAETLDRLADLFSHVGADLTFELSGNPAALDQAIAVTGFDGRVLIGSWYGRKQVALDLGGRFHRSRICLIASQVSTIEPSLQGRWTKSRRLEFAWCMVRDLRPSHLITHRFPIDQAAEAYRLLDQNPAEAIQVVLSYY